MEDQPPPSPCFICSRALRSNHGVSPPLRHKLRSLPDGIEISERHTIPPGSLSNSTTHLVICWKCRKGALRMSDRLGLSLDQENAVHQGAQQSSATPQSVDIVPRATGIAPRDENLLGAGNVLKKQKVNSALINERNTARHAFPNKASGDVEEEEISGGQGMQGYEEIEIQPASISTGKKYISEQGVGEGSNVVLSHGAAGEAEVENVQGLEEVMLGKSGGLSLREDIEKEELLLARQRLQLDRERLEFDKEKLKVEQEQAEIDRQGRRELQKQKLNFLQKLGEMAMVICNTENDQ